MNIFILISGSSSRFYKQNFKKPKFLINVKGKLIIEHIISNFDKQNDAMNQEMRRIEPYTVLV